VKAPAVVNYLRHMASVADRIYTRHGKEHHLLVGPISGGIDDLRDAADVDVVVGVRDIAVHLSRIACRSGTPLAAPMVAITYEKVTPSGNLSPALSSVILRGCRAEFFVRGVKE
jgi:hypothetical protein